MCACALASAPVLAAQLLTTSLLAKNATTTTGLCERAAANLIALHLAGSLFSFIGGQGGRASSPLYLLSH